MPCGLLWLDMTASRGWRLARARGIACSTRGAPAPGARQHAGAPARAPGQPCCPPPSNDRRRQPRKRRRHGHEPPPEDDLGPPPVRQHPHQLRDGAAFVRPPRRHDGVTVPCGGNARVAPERVHEHEHGRKRSVLRAVQRPAERADPAALGQDELQDPLHHLAAVAGQKRSHAGEQDGLRGRGDSHHRTPRHNYPCASAAVRASMARMIDTMSARPCPSAAVSSYRA